jgi:hypothetical protein
MGKRKKDTSKDIDIHEYDRKFSNGVKLVETSDITENSRKLLLEWKDDLLTKEKLTKARIIKLLAHIRHISIIAHKESELDKDFEFYTDKEIGKVFSLIDEDPNKNEWAEYDYRRAFKKFISWIRDKKGYPKGYTLTMKGREYDSEELIKLLLVSKKPPELNGFKIKTPKKLKDASKIPTKKQIRYLRDAAIHPRDKAYIASSEELGPRVGGLGTRKIKHLIFDDLGIKILMSDKTMEGEPVRLIEATPFLRNWIENHPFKGNPDAPLWIDLHYTDRPVPLKYASFRAILKRATDRHNRKAEIDSSLEKIPRYYSTHDFRYYAETRDQLEGIPEGVRKKQRGWSDRSKQPATYGRLVSKDVDDVWAKRCGIKTEVKEKDEPIDCPRCRKSNPFTATFCGQCGAPLELKTAIELESKSDQVGKDFIDMASQNPELINDAKKFIEMLEIIKENPEIQKEVAVALKKNET